MSKPTPPKCHKCKENKEVVWVNLGPRLEYWYCRTCKVEVSNTYSPPPPPTSSWGGPRLATNQDMIQVIDGSLDLPPFLISDSINVPTLEDPPKASFKYSNEEYIRIKNKISNGDFMLTESEMNYLDIIFNQLEGEIR